MTIDPFPNDHTTATLDLLHRYRAAIDRLRAYGLRSNTQDRLHRYARVIARLGPIEHDAMVDEERKSLANALCEASIFLDIASLPSAYLAAVQAKLVMLNAGNEFEDVEHPDRARDAAVELQVAARCNVRGCLGDPATNRGDLLVRVASGQYPAEVKRVSSVERVRQRVKEAADQLTPTGQEPCGIITLDVSASARSNFDFIEAADPSEFLDVAFQQLASFVRHYVIGGLEWEDVAREGVLGLIVRHVAYGWAGNQANVRRSIVTQAIRVALEGSHEDAQFTEIATSIETGELVGGTDDAMRNAVEAFPLPLLARHRPVQP